MKKIFTLILFLLSQVSFAQVNLVPNPSFESYSLCPTGADEIDKAVGWSSSRNSPDYYNACATSISTVSIPFNIFGYQYPASGNAYAGFWAKNANNYREYFGVQLISNLQIGTKYYVSIKVSLSPNPVFSRYCGVNKIGALFSTVYYNTFNNPAPLNNYSQAYTDSIITDTLNWVIIKESFVADSAYSFINIGNFFKDSLTDSIQIIGNICEAYYYVDDICVSTDSIYAYNYTWTGFNEIKAEESIKYYPNPFKDYITIDNNGNNIKSIELYDIYGQPIRTEKLNHAEHYRWNLKNIPPGIYNLIMQNKNLNTINKIIIKL
ncbi:MAG: T9SS type A sorting domain-containing protein [Bacteroidia bacterium]